MMHFINRQNNDPGEALSPNKELTQALIKSQDTGDYTEFFTLAREHCYRVASSKVYVKEDAEDLTQNLMAKLVSIIDRSSELLKPDTIQSYINVLIRNATIDLWKKGLRSIETPASVIDGKSDSEEPSILVRLQDPMTEEEGPLLTAEEIVNVLSSSDIESIKSLLTWIENDCDFTRTSRLLSIERGALHTRLCRAKVEARKLLSQAITDRYEGNF